MKYAYDKNNQVAYGHEQVYAIREDTGERILIDSFEERTYGQSSFWKLEKPALQLLLQLSSAQASAIFVYILSNMETRENEVNVTFDEISKGTNVAYKTVSRTMETFKKHDFVRMIRKGKWMVNPTMIYRGKPWVQSKLRAKYYSIDKDSGQ